MERSPEERETPFHRNSAAEHEARLERSVQDAIDARDAAVDRELEAILSGDDEEATTVTTPGGSVDIVPGPGGWIARVPGWALMTPFPTKLEAITYAEEWLAGRI